MKILRFYLSNAKKKVMRKESGRAVMVYDASSHDALMSLAFDKGEQSAVPMRFGAKIERAEDFDRLYISHDAQLDQWIELAFLEDGEKLELGGLLVCNPAVDPVNHVSVTAENLTTSQTLMYTVPDNYDFYMTKLSLKGASGAKIVIRQPSTPIVHTWEWTSSALVIPETVDGHRVWLGPGWKVGFYGDGGGTAVATVEGYLRKR